MCRFCAATCGVVVRTEGERVVGVVGDADHPVTHGYICSKGRRLGELHHHPERLDRAAIGRLGDRREVTLDVALDDLTAGLRAALDAGGPDAAGVYLGGGGYFEKGLLDVAAGLLGHLGSRSLYSTLTLDNIPKPVVSQLLTGTRAVVAPLVDWEHAETILIVGSNPVVSHGHDWAFPDPIRRLRAIRERGGEVWVVDPRETETAKHATVHLAPRPGTDHELLAHLVRELLADGADKAYLSEHADGVEDLRRAVEPFDRRRVAEATGVPAELLDSLVERLRSTGRVSGRSGTGLTMGRAPCVGEWLLWALHGVTGSFERPGGLWFNPDFFARQDLVAPPSGPPMPAPGPASRPDLPSWLGQYPCAALCDEIEAGNLRALVVLGGNPGLAVPDAARVRAALERLDVLAVLEVRNTETTELATHLLPCTGPLEHDTLSYARMAHRVHGQVVPRVVVPSGDRHPQWWYLTQLGDRLGVQVRDGIDAAIATDDDHLRLVAGPHVDLDQLRAAVHGIDLGVPSRWVEDWVLPGGRWQLAPPALVAQLGALAQEPLPVDGLRLVPRRQPRHLNSSLREGLGSAGVRDLPELLLHPDDALPAGVADGEAADLVTAVGVVRCRVATTDLVRRGTTSLPHGYAEPNVNVVVPTEVDPVSGMVRLAGVAVSVRPPAPVHPQQEGPHHA